MIQNILALALVSLAVGYTMYSLYKGITTKKAGHCSGCTACSLKETHH